MDFEDDQITITNTYRASSILWPQNSKTKCVQKQMGTNGEGTKTHTNHIFVS